jgi:hypothetical protein
VNKPPLACGTKVVLTTGYYAKQTGIVVDFEGYNLGLTDYWYEYTIRLPSGYACRVGEDYIKVKKPLRRK